MADPKKPGVSRPRRQFTDEFRREAVRLVLERGPGVSFTHVARQLELTAPRLRLWVKAAQAKAGEATAARGSAGGPERTAPKETAAQELRRLRREVEELRQERDFAKKAAAYFAKESR